MALLKCPDCGKMVSERATICPECGCPKEYFAKIENKKKAEEKYNEENIKEEKITKEKISFVLGVAQITYPKDLYTFAQMFGKYMQLSDEVYSKAKAIYNDAGNIGSAVSLLEHYALNKLSSIIDDGVKLLYQCGQYMTAEEFMNKYEISYGQYLTQIKEKCEDVFEKRAIIQERRDIDRGMRGRWQGGGFGLKGAVKGAVTAGVLNAGSDLIHSIGDSAQDKSDDKAALDQLKSIYENNKTRNILCNGLKICVLDIYDGMVNELKLINYFPEFINFNVKKEQALFESTIKYSENEGKKLEKLIECLTLFPGDKRITDEIIKIIISYKEDELCEWLQFWNLAYRYPDYIKNRKKGMQFDNYCCQQGINKFDFRDYGVENYIKLRKFVLEYYDKYFCEHLPEFSIYTKKIQYYYNNLDDITSLYETVEWIPAEFDIYEYMEYINKERESLTKSFLKDVWLYGDNITKIPEKIRNILDTDEALPLIYYDKSFWGTGGNGILVTTKYIYDLKKKIKISLCNVEEIKRNDNGSIVFITTNELIVFKDNLINEYNKLHHLANLISVICVRYAGNYNLWNEMMTSPKPMQFITDIGKPKSDEQKKLKKVIQVLEKMDDILDGYILMHPQKNKEEVFIDFLKKYNIVVEIKKKSIFCSFCGNKIDKSIKFCNYCGKPNKYNN